MARLLRDFLDRGVDPVLFEDPGLRGERDGREAGPTAPIDLLAVIEVVKMRVIIPLIPDRSPKGLC